MHNIWAVEPNAIQAYLEKRESITADNQLAINAISQDNIKPDARSIFSKQQATDLFDISGSEATIRIIGVLTQDGPDWIDNLFGLAVTGYNQLIEAIDLISSDETIKNVKLIMDTPGGEASGCDLVCDSLKELASKVTLTAFNFGMIASAGYWLATAASKIIATSPTNETGSIGVLITGFDFTEALAKDGIKFVKIRSQNAPKKAPGISTKEDIQLLKDRINAIERVFISRVAEGRNVTEKDVIKNFGKGAVLIAQDPDSKIPDAIDVGMIDSVLSKLKVNTNNTNKNNIKSQTLKENKMDFKQLCIDNPGLQEHVNSLVSDARKAGVEDTNKEVATRVAYAGPIMVSDAYKPAVKQLAAKVITGESQISALESVVTIADMQIEEDKAAQVLLDQKDKDTLATGPKADDDSGVVNSAESYKAVIDDAKKRQNRAVN